MEDLSTLYIKPEGVVLMPGSLEVRDRKASWEDREDKAAGKCSSSRTAHNRSDW